MSLDFTELSQFKHLVHLSLVVLKATDSQLKDYLVDSLVSMKRDKEAVEGELREAAGNLQERLEGCQSQLEAKSCELEQWKSENRQQTTNLGQRLAKEVAEEKEKIQSVACFAVDASLKAPRWAHSTLYRGGPQWRIA